MQYLQCFEVLTKEKLELGEGGVHLLNNFCMHRLEYYKLYEKDYLTLPHDFSG